VKLFDDIEREDFGPPLHNEPQFTYLNRSAHSRIARVREVLETWFSRYPEPKKDLQMRLRSDDENHLGALFELVLYELLFRLGCEVTPHPKLSETTRHPDFLAKPPNGDSFCLEATTGLLPSRAGTQVSSGVRVRFANHVPPISRKVHDKAGHYGKLQLPYVIAVNALDPGVDEAGFEKALFGQEPADLRNPTRVGGIPDGVWQSRFGQQWRRVSAVLAASGLHARNIARAPVWLYHNPWAERPYSSVLTRLPQLVPEGDKMKWVPGESLGSILGLPPGWPRSG
jgi:hypothetical protein